MRGHVGLNGNCLPAGLLDFSCSLRSLIHIPICTYDSVACLAESQSGGTPESLAHISYKHNPRCIHMQQDTVLRWSPQAHYVPTVYRHGSFEACMALERFFRRKKPTRGDDDNSPTGLWLKCEGCGAQIYRKDLVANRYVCPECTHHHRMPVDDRIALLADDGTFEQWSGAIGPLDPLGFTDTEPYPERLARTQQKQKRPDAIKTGAARLHGEPIALVVMDYFFSGGSMGSVVGEEIARAAERAASENRSLIAVTASGGARMQEGALSLMQMAKTTMALELLSEKGLPYISILTDPTTGGVTASFATLGDLVLAEPKALICFAGPRVIQQTIKQDLPEGAQRSEFLLRKGMLDAVISRNNLKDQLGQYVRLLRSGLPEVN